MNDPLILTFDLGTQSARALLIDSNGQIIAKTKKVFEKPYFSHNPGWAEQKADFYWDAICETSLLLKQEAGTDWQRVIAVTSTTIRDTVLCVDKNNKPLRDVILWLDKREAQGLKPLPLTNRSLFKAVGMLEKAKMHQRQSACNWIIKNEPEIWEKTHKFVMISTWLNAKFCGNLIDSYANMVGHIPFDVKTSAWMKKSNIRRPVFNVSNEKLALLTAPGTEIGVITPTAAAETGITKGTPFITTGPDKGCETLGLSCTTAKRAALSFGTTATIEIMTDKYLEILPMVPPFPAVLPNAYNPELEIYRGYWLISWFKKEFGLKEVEEAKTLGVSAEELLNERLREIPPGCDGLMLQPYFTPGVDMPNARGAIIGFSDIHTRIHIYRAIIEGINYGLIEGLRAIEKQSKQKIEKIFVAGGGSQSGEICQITANMFGLNLYRTQTYEVSGLGSAMIGFVSKGIFPTYEKAAESMVHIRDEFIPDKQEHERYKALYNEAFSKIFKHLSPLYKKIDTITN